MQPYHEGGEREAYIEKVKQQLLNLPQGSKLWWTKVRELVGEEIKKCNIPALKDEDGSCVTEAKDKTNLLARTMHAKCTLREREVNRFTKLKSTAPLQWELRMPTEETGKIMSNLRKDSGTGPGQLPARTLKMCNADLGCKVMRLSFGVSCELDNVW